MFWKTMAAVWTALLLILVAMLWTVRTGGQISVVGGSTRQPAVPAGTQAMVLMADVPSPYHAAAGRMLEDRDFCRRVLMDMRVRASALYEGLGQDPIRGLRRHLAMRPAGEAGSGLLAVYARRCEHAPEATDLASAAAEHFARRIGETEALRLDEQLRALKAQRDDLRTRRDRIRRERAACLGASPMAAMPKRRSLLSLRLEILTRGVVDAETRQARAQAELAAFKKDVLQGRPRAPATGAATKPAPAGPDAQALQRAKQKALALATQELADLRERYNEARAEARDLEVTLGRLRALEEEAETHKVFLGKLEDRILELELKRHRKDLGPRIIGCFALR